MHNFIRPNVEPPLDYAMVKISDSSMCICLPCEARVFLVKNSF